jgi:hypothetical protein
LSEVEVVASLLQQDYGDSISNNIPLVLQESLSVSGLTIWETHEQLTKSLLSQASEQAPADLIRDFCDKNGKPQPVWPELKARKPVVLLTQAELNDFFPEQDTKQDGWDRFYAKYPKSPGIITVSRVGFNRKGDLAMVYLGIQSHWLAGHGSICVLRKRDGKWVHEPVGIGPLWVS